MYVSMNQVCIGSDNGLAPVRRQAIISTNVQILSSGPLGTNFSVFFNQNTKLFICENASENIICEMAAILSTGRWVNKLHLVRETGTLGPEKVAPLT